MTEYTVHLFRSGRVFVMEGHHPVPYGINPPLLTQYVQARSEIAALGKVLLVQTDRANQPHQHVCAPCIAPCCEEVCECGNVWSKHQLETHTFTPRPQQPHVCAPCELPHVPQPTGPRHHNHPACDACRLPREGNAHSHPACEACR